MLQSQGLVNTSFLFFFPTWSRHSHTRGTFRRDWGFYKNPWCETDSCLHESRLMTMSWLRCNSLMRLRREGCPKRVHVYTWLTTDTVCLWSAHSYENIRPMHTLLWWFIADTSGGEDIQETVGTEGIGLGQWNINIPFKKPRTFLRGTRSQWHILESWCWHGACTWPSFIAPVCPLWLGVLSVCVEVLCEQLGPKTPGSRAPSSNISWLALEAPVLGKHRP